MAIFRATTVEAAAASFGLEGELTMCFPERLLAFSPLLYGNGEKALASCLFSDSARTVWCSTEVKSVAAPS